MAWERKQGTSSPPAPLVCIHLPQRHPGAQRLERNPVGRVTPDKRAACDLLWPLLGFQGR